VASSTAGIVRMGMSRFGKSGTLPRLISIVPPPTPPIGSLFADLLRTRNAQARNTLDRTWRDTRAPRPEGHA
jgi:hypothetical protein